MNFEIDSEMPESLKDLVESDTWKALLNKIDGLASNIEKNVLKYSLSNGAEGLAYEKARAEGARQLQIAIKSLSAKKRSRSRAGSTT